MPSRGRLARPGPVGASRRAARPAITRCDARGGAQRQAFIANPDNSRRCLPHGRLSSTARASLRQWSSLRTCRVLSAPASNMSAAGAAASRRPPRCASRRWPSPNARHGHPGCSRAFGSPGAAGDAASAFRRGTNAGDDEEARCPDATASLPPPGRQRRRAARARATATAVPRDRAVVHFDGRLYGGGSSSASRCARCRRARVRAPPKLPPQLSRDAGGSRATLRPSRRVAPPAQIWRHPPRLLVDDRRRRRVDRQPRPHPRVAQRRRQRPVTSEFAEQPPTYTQVALRNHLEPHQVWARCSSSCLLRRMLSQSESVAPANEFAETRAPSLCCAWAWPAPPPDPRTRRPDLCRAVWLLQRGDRRARLRARRCGRQRRRRSAAGVQIGMTLPNLFQLQIQHVRVRPADLQQVLARATGLLFGPAVAVTAARRRCRRRGR